jgi:H+/Cl- antiporter ClcA
MLRRHLHRTRRQFLSVNKWKLRIVFWGGAVALGAIAAVFALASYRADGLFRSLYDYNPMLAYVLGPIGLALVAFVTHRYFVGTEGSGIPQAIAAITMRDRAERDKVLSLKVAAGKILLTCGGLLSGASIGREGPTVHIGASIMYSLRHIIPFRGKDLSRAMILAGGAAGISAAFNTPLAGILFAIEEMSRSFEERTSGTLLIAVILSGITALVILGNYTYFGTTSASIGLSDAWLLVLICGVVGGLLGGIFSQSLVYFTRKISPWLKRYPIRIALLCGIIISLVGFLSGGATYGTGYHEAKALVTGSGDATAALEFPLLKFFATLVSYLSGIPGGIFAPSLSIGAGIGADLSQLFPAAPMAAIVMLGMVGYFTGVVQTPITALVIVMEMTDNSSMLLPLMITALIAKGVSSLVCPEPIYGALAEAYLEKTAAPTEPAPTEEPAPAGETQR